MSANPLSSNLVSLRKDAGKVLDDISRLSKEIESLGTQRASATATAAKEALGTSVDALQSNAGELAKLAQKLATRMQKQVAAKPYHHAVGLLGVVLVAGYLVRRRLA